MEVDKLLNVDVQVVEKHANSGVMRSFSYHFISLGCH